ncbi:GNAT family N-acetyltransferase [Leeuwenhoekiella sp. H156]|uniref:GNAT family N-acetyltransferase n=1 Tax=Leeuwenhoekiella sp. H156 TaxID=3450128 RepID=UPI003FA47D13
MISVTKYTPDYKSRWDRFVTSLMGSKNKGVKNTSFLFSRAFIAYHGERFEDHSLLFFKDEKVIAVLPANREGANLYSHQGLTYGALVLEKGIAFAETKQVVEALLQYLKTERFQHFQIKFIPQFYIQQPAYELEHLLLEAGAQVVRSQLNFGIDYNRPYFIHATKERRARQAEDRGLRYAEADFAGFWNGVLKPRLAAKFDTEPVHSLGEIELLQKQFPYNIKQINCYQGETLLAGVTLFLTEDVVKSQYGATTPEGEKLRAMDFLFVNLIQDYKDAGYRFFDMGTVQGSRDEAYNFGLIKQKEELGAQVYLQHTLKLDL